MTIPREGEQAGRGNSLADDIEHFVHSQTVFHPPAYFLMASCRTRARSNTRVRLRALRPGTRGRSCRPEVWRRAASRALSSRSCMAGRPRPLVPMGSRTVCMPAIVAFGDAIVSIEMVPHDHLPGHHHILTAYSLAVTASVPNFRPSLLLCSSSHPLTLEAESILSPFQGSRPASRLPESPSLGLSPLGRSRWRYALDRARARR